MKYNRTLRKTGGIACIAGMLMHIGIGIPKAYGDQTWTNGTTNLLWGDAGNWTSAIPLSTDNVIFGTPVIGGSTITLGTGSLANALSFKNNYTLTGGDLTLTTGGVRVNLGYLDTIGSQLLGTAGLTKTGGGTLRLTNASNSYTGTTTINDGIVSISDQAALGGDSSAIVVNGSATRGFGGGALLLEGGYSSGVTLSRGVTLQGLGPIGASGVALISVGNNSITGTLSNGAALVNTAVNSAGGRLTMGDVTIGGTAGTTFMTFGAGNGVGAGSYAITGALTGTGTIGKTGAGTLLLTPSSSSGFSGIVQTSAGSIRVSTDAALGTSTAANAVDLNGGIMEFRSDAPNFSTRKVNLNNGGTLDLFLDRAVGGTGLNQTVTFANFDYDAGETLTFNSRNGYNVTFTAATAIGSGTGDNGTTYNGNGLATFGGTVWGNTNGTARTYTISGTGNQLYSGSITASGANHILVKSGTGTATIQGTGSTYLGATTTSGGALVITDFRSLNAHSTGTNASAINIGSTTTAGILTIGTATAATAAGLTLLTGKAINLNGTTGGATINANQSFAAPVIIGSVTATGAGAKTLTLGGTSTQNNIISGAIPDSTAATSLVKADAGTWVLAATGAGNTYTGSSTITAGTLKIKANAATTSTVVGEAAGNTVVFNANATTLTAGGTLELLGFAGSATTETLGALTPTAGAATVKLTADASPAATNLVFTSLVAPAKTTGVNFSTTAGSGGTVTITGLAAATATVLPGGGHLYFNGADFADSTAGVLSGPVGGYVAAGAIFTTAAAGAATLTSAKHNSVLGNITAQTVITVSSLKIGTASTLTTTGKLTINQGATTTDGNILVSGGVSAAISGTGLISTGGTGAIVIRTDAAGDTLQLNTNLQSDTSGGLTKNGLGKLVINAVNAQTGATTINEGTVQLLGTGRLAAVSQSLDIRQGATLDLNAAAATQTQVNAFGGAGTVANTSASAATFAFGNTTGSGIFSGIISETSGVINVTKGGTTSGGTLNGLNTYTGVTTIGGTTGLVSVNTLANIGTASSIGKGLSTNDTTNAASLVFAATTGGLNYTGTTSVSIDRLFTLNGSAASSGAQIANASANNSTLIFNKTNAIAFGAGATVAQTLTLGGISTGDNQINLQITDNAALRTSLSKIGAGVWILGAAANSYTGTTTITAGALGTATGTALSANSPLVFGGGQLLSSGNFTRNLVAAVTPGNANEVNWSAGGGFAGSDAKLIVAIGGLATPSALTWASSGFLPSGNLILNSATALSEVEFRNAIDLNGVNRTIQVDDNANTFTDFATITGVISGTGGLTKTGTGTLQLFAANTYSGATAVTAASTLAVNSLGNSANPGVGTSLGTSTNANLAANALTLGNAGTTAGILQYVGPGETSDRMIRLNTTTGTTQIHADGAGPLILTNVLNDMAAGAKTLFLRGSNTEGNMITSTLADNGGALGVAADGGATWILPNANTYTGVTTASAGALGAGNDASFGTGTLRITNGSLFAYGSDRTFTNPVQDNSTTTATTATFIGDYGIALTSPWTHTNTTAGQTITNGIVPGKTLTLGGDVQFNSITGNVTATFNGTGDTILNGSLTTSTAFNTGLTYSGTGNLTLAGTSSDMNGGTLTVSSGTLKLGSNEVIPHGAVANTTTTAASTASTTVTVASTTGLVVGQVFTGTGVAAGSTVATIVDGTTFTASAAQTIASGAQLLFDQKAGNMVISPAAAVTATFDLNGKSETINGLTASAGPATSTTVINNSSATPASLTFGTNDQTVAIGGGGGAYTISNTGGGALSLTKTGTGAGTISTGVTLSYTGTTSVTGGSLTSSSAVNGTTGLSVTGTGSILALNGGITSPSAVTSVSVGNGSTLNLLDGAGNQLTNLGTLTLGTASGTNTTLGFNVGDSVTTGDNVNTDKFALTAVGILNLFAGNKITFNLTDAGLNANTDYVLLDGTAIGGGFTSGPLVLGDYILGATPGGFTAMDLTTSSTNNQIILRTGTLITGASYWRGALGGGTDTTWNASAGNWATDKINTAAAASIPGQGTDVFFQINTGSNAAVTTTLEQNFKINSLTFEADGTPANTPTSVTINPGVVSTSRLEVAPQVATDGVKITAGGPAAVTIAAPFRIGAPQTWSVADAASVLTLSGGLTGEGDVTVSGAGKVSLGAAAASTFNTGLTTDVTITGGALEMTNSGALGTTALGNRANVAINGGAFFYNNATAGTVQNNLTLGGGTLSAGGNTQIYSGTVNIGGNSTINMRENNSATTTTTQRNITLSGLLSGSSSITLDSIDTPTAGNQISGTLTINNGSSTWNGPLNFTRGSVVFTNVAGSGTATPYVGYNGTINFDQFGRAIYRNVDGASLSRTAPLNYAAAAVGEFSVDNVGALASNYTITQSGAVNLNAGSIVRFNMADVASNLNLTGGVVLNGNASISVAGGDADSLVTISGTGISGTGDLAINDEAGVWAVTSTRLAINAAGSFTGNTSLNEGTLILGHKDALSTGSLTITGASTLQSSVDLSATGSGPVPNAVTLNAGLTVSGTNSVTLNGLFTGTGGDADRTLTSSLTGPAALVLSGGVNIGAGANTVARTLTIAGTGATTISSAIVDGSAFANNLSVTNTGVTTLTAVNTYTGTTTMNAATGTLLLQGSNSSAGATTLTTGTIQFDSASNGGLASGTLTLTAGTLTPLNAGRSISNSTLLGGTVAVTGSQNLTFSGNFTNNAGNRTLNNNLTGGAKTTLSGNIYLSEITGTGRTLTIGGTADTDITGIVANFNGGAGTAGVLAKTGAGVLTVSNTGNTYTGGTTVNFGTVRTSASNVIPNTGTVTVNATTAGTALFDLNGNSETIAALTFGGTGGLATSVNQVTTGAGTLTLGGTVTVTATGNWTNPALLSGNVALGANRTFSVADSTGTVTDLDVPATLTGAFSLTKSGAGTMLLGSTSNSYSGGTVINLGVVRSGASNVLPNTGTITVNQTAAGTSALLDLNGFDDTIAALTFGGTSGIATSVNQVTTGAGTLTLGGTVTVTATGNWATPALLSGKVALGATRTFSVANSTGTDVDLDVQAVVSGATFGITKTGLGTMLLSAANTYTGATTINNGIVRYGVNNALDSANAVTVNANAASTTAILDLNDFNGTIGSLTIGGTSQTSTSASVIQTGAGTLTLGGNVTTNATGNPTSTPLITGKVDLGAANRTFTVADSTGSLVDLDVQAVVSGSVGLIKTGAGALQLSGTNTYSGKTVIASGPLAVGVVDASASANQPLGTHADLDLGVAGTSSGTLVYTGATDTLAKNINALGNGSDTIQNLGSGLLSLTGTITKSGTTLTLAGGVNGIAISGSGTITGTVTSSDLIINGGTTTLGTVNTYNGPTFIRNGAVLNANVTDALPTANGRSAIVLDDTGTGSSILNLGASQSIASLTGAATSSVALGSNTLTIGAASGSTTFAGIIGGSGGGLIKDDASTLVLSGPNTFTGTMAINAGTVQVTHASGLGSDVGGTTVASGASLILSNVNVGNESITINGNGVGGLGALQATGTSTITAALNIATDSYIGVASVSDTLNLTGNLTGSAGYTKIGAGTIVVSGSGSSYSGVTTVSAGTLLVTDPSALGGTGGGTVVAPGAILELGSGVSIGAEDLILQSTSGSSFGTLRSGSGANTWGGNISFTGGFGGLSAAPGATLNLTGATINKTDVALTISGGGTVNINNVIGGDGDTGEFNDDLIVNGATVQLNALNTYTGPTVVRGGGTLRNGITDALPNSSIVGSGGSTTLTLGHSADGAVTNTYDLNGYNQTVATLNNVITGSNANIITNHSAITDSTLSVSAGDFSGVIQDGGSGKTVNLIKQGDVADVLVLKGSNTYTGTTVVMNGTLQVGYNDAGTTGTGLTTVQAGATLAGTGTILGDASISGVLKPGDSSGALMGVLDIAGSLTLTGTSTSYFDIGDPSLVFDQVHNTLGTGVLTLGGFIDLGTLFAGGYVPVAGDTWALFDNFGTIAGSFNPGSNLRVGGTGGGDLFLPTLTGIYKWDVSQFTTNGTIAIYVPEPSRALLLLVGMLGIFGRRRRRND